MRNFALLAAVALLSVSTAGCFVELNTGLYSASRSGAAATAGNTDIKGAWNVGINVGAAWDVERKVRVGLAIGYESLKFSGADDGKGSAAGLDLGLLADYTITDLSDDVGLRASVRAMFGGGKMTYTPNNGGEFSEDGKGLKDIHVGASLTLFGKSQEEVYVMAGPRYIKETGDTFGSVTAVGLGFVLGFQWTPGGSEASNRPSGDDPIMYRSELSNDENVIPALAAGAARAGCDASLDGQTMTARCAGGNIGAVQDGRTVVRICQAGMDEYTCQSIWKRVLDAAVGN